MADGRTLAAHREALRNMSPVFAAMLASGMVEVELGRMSISDADFDAVKAVYDFYVMGGKEPQVGRSLQNLQLSTERN